MMALEAPDNFQLSEKITLEEPVITSSPPTWPPGGLLDFLAYLPVMDADQVEQAVQADTGDGI